MYFSATRKIFLCCVVSLVFAATSVETNGLTAFYYATGGSQWTTSTNWLVGDPCGNSWVAVACDSNSNIKSLIINNNNLQGSIPSEFGNWFPSMQQLIIYSEPGLKGPIPASLANMTLMFQLWLFENNHNGTIPEMFTNLKSLSYLAIRSNPLLTGPIPRTLVNATAMIKMELYLNNLTGVFPEIFLGMQALTEAYFDGNPFLTGRIPTSLSSATNLQKVGLAGNNFNGTIPDIFVPLTSLQSIALQFNSQLQGPLPPSLVTLPSLISLNLGALPNFVSNFSDSLMNSLQAFVLDSSPNISFNLTLLCGKSWLYCSALNSGRCVSGGQSCSGCAVSTCSSSSMMASIITSSSMDYISTSSILRSTSRWSTISIISAITATTLTSSNTMSSPLTTGPLDRNDGNTSNSMLLIIGISAGAGSLFLAAVAAFVVINRRRHAHSKRQSSAMRAIPLSPHTDSRSLHDQIMSVINPLRDMQTFTAIMTTADIALLDFRPIEEEARSVSEA